MLRLTDLRFAIDGRPLFECASAVLPAGPNVGVVGRTGTGKTTLFRLIRGELALESGDIALPKGARIGGVSQEVPSSQTSLLDTVLEADTERAALLAERTEDAERIAEIQARLADIDAWSAEARASSILRGLGFDAEAQSRPCADFSGGWRMRVALAAVLFSAPDLLLLDEPTNYLDLEGALWLEDYLQKYPHTVIIVSHDRGLLNRAVGSILHLEDQKLTLYQGSYDSFAETRAARLADAQARAKKQEATRAHLQSYVDRFRYKADKARQAQSRLKALARMTPITMPQEAGLRRFDFPQPEELSPPILRLEGCAVGYDETPVLSKIDLRIDQDDRIALLGQNGEGKSTLSKLLCNKLQVQGGKITRARKLRVGYFAQHQTEELHKDETPLDHLARALPDLTPSTRRAKLAGFGLHAAQAETLVADLSGGQKARLTLLLATLDAPHLLVLDEPTNHLDIESREALIEALTAYEGSVVLVSHDMHLLSLVSDRLWLVKNGRVREYDGDLTQYRADLLKQPERPQIKTAKPATPKNTLKELQAEVSTCEARIIKIKQILEKVEARLADPAIYDADASAELQQMQSKHREATDGLERAETLWLEAQDALERAQNP